MYGYFYYLIIRIKILRRIIFLFLVFFPIFWLATVIFRFGLHTWNSYVVTLGSFFSVVFAILYYCQLVTAEDIQPLRKLPEFWIATGMLIFYLGALPFLGTLNFFTGYYLAHRGFLHSLFNVIKILNTLMYALFSFGFLWRIINTRKS